MPTHHIISAFFESTQLKKPVVFQEEGFDLRSPITGERIASIIAHRTEDVEKIVTNAQEAAAQWRDVPMPLRGRLIGIFGDVLRQHKSALADLVTLEA